MAVTVRIKSDKIIPTKKLVAFIDDCIGLGILSDHTIHHHEVKGGKEKTELVLYNQPAPNGEVELIRLLEPRWIASYTSITTEPYSKPKTKSKSKSK